MMAENLQSSFVAGVSRDDFIGESGSGAYIERPAALSATGDRVEFRIVSLEMV